MYLKQTDIGVDESLIDVPFYQKGFYSQFRGQVYHIVCHFDRLIFHKIKNDNFWKTILRFYPQRPVNDEFGNGRKKYRDLLGVLEINAYFDFYQYMRLESDIDKSRMIADVFEDELLMAFNEYGIESAAVEDAFREIRQNDYVYRGSFYKDKYKNYLYSPNKTYKVFFSFVWKLNWIEVWINVKKPRSTSDICNVQLATIRPQTFTFGNYVSSIVWLSEHEFAMQENDISGRKIRFNILEGSVQEHQP